MIPVRPPASSGLSQSASAPEHASHAPQAPQVGAAASGGCSGHTGQRLSWRTSERIGECSGQRNHQRIDPRNHQRIDQRNHQRIDQRIDHQRQVVTSAEPGRSPAAAAVNDRQPTSPWVDSLEALALFAVDPHGLGGVLLRARAGPIRDRWLAALREALPEATPMRRIPLQIGDGRLLGGLDLAATLSSGRPVVERGLLAEVDGGIAVIAMAERVEAGVAAKLGSALDHGEVRLERDGFAARFDSRFGAVVLDESAHEDEAVPAALRERMAFLVDLSDIPLRQAIEPPVDREQVEAARACLPSVTIEDRWLEALCATASSLGVDSPRASIAAVRAARASAALDGRSAVEEKDAVLAGRLVFAPRATCLPPDDSAEPPPAEPPAEPPPPPPDENESRAEEDKPDQEPPDENPPDENPPDENDSGRLPDEMLLDAVRAAIPAGLLAQLQASLAPSAARSAGGRSGAVRRGQRRGRPAGSRPGEPRGGARIAVVDTLRAAAPWQALRKRERERARSVATSVTTAAATAAATFTPNVALGAGSMSTSVPRSVPASVPVPVPVQGRRIEVRADDFRVQRYRERAQTTTIFSVDASGSQALNRLAEAKGAVELLLADCYVRRDQVALIAFRGAGAEVMLPPTRSLARARRSLAGLPGGGGTPLASGIDASRALVEAVRRKGDSVVLIMMTDGRGNLARDGKPDRDRAQADALAAAVELRVCGVQTLLIDTSARPHPAALKIAEAMGARYLALPYADAATLSGAVKQVVSRGEAGGMGRGPARTVA